MNRIDTNAEPECEWHRVHWVGLVERLLGAIVAVGLVVAFSGLPSGLGAWGEEVFGTLAGIRAVVAYFRRRYCITPTVITTRSGAIFRTEESMRRSDVQSVSTSVPLWYRPLDLARVAVSDDSGHTIEIAPVKRTIADRFQQVMAPHHSTVEGPVGSEPQAPVTASALQPAEMAETATPSLSASAGPTTPAPVTRRIDVGWWRVVLFAAGDGALVIAAVAVGVMVYLGWWIAAAATVVVWVGWASMGIASMMRFRLTVDGDEIRTGSGLLTDEQQRTTRQRVEFLRVDETLVGRRLGIERVTIGTADDTMTIAPAQRSGEWSALADLVLGVEHGARPPIEPISARSVPRFRFRGAILALVAGAGAASRGWWYAVVTVGVVGLLAVVWFPRARLARFGVGGAGDLLVARSGFAPHRRWLFRVDRIDSTDRTATVSQRRAGITNISFSGRGPMSSLTIPDLDRRTALDWDERIAAGVAGRIKSGRVDREPRASLATGVTAADRVSASPAIARYDEPLPPAAVRFNTFTAVLVAIVIGLLWIASMVWAVATRPSESIWRSPWLIGGGSLVVVGGAVAAIAISRRAVRAERWSVDDAFVDRRAGVFLQVSTRVKLDQVAVVRWAQGPLERRFGLGQVRLFTSGASNPDLILAYLDEADARYIAELHRAREGPVTRGRRNGLDEAVPRAATDIGRLK